MMKSRKRCRNSYEPSTAKRNRGKRRHGIGEALERCPPDARTNFADAGGRGRPTLEHISLAPAADSRSAPSARCGRGDAIDLCGRQHILTLPGAAFAKKALVGVRRTLAKAFFRFLLFESRKRGALDCSCQVPTSRNEMKVPRHPGERRPRIGKAGRPPSCVAKRSILIA